MNAHNMPKLMRVNEPEQSVGPWVGYEGAAEHTGLSNSYLRKLVMMERIPFRKIGKRVLFSIAELDSWVNESGDTDKQVA